MVHRHNFDCCVNANDEKRIFTENGNFSENTNDDENGHILEKASESDDGHSDEE